MSSPVATVPPDAQLKDVAAILVEHGTNAVPVVDDPTGCSRSCPRPTSSRWRPSPPRGRAGRYLRPVWARLVSG
jgi:CBS domain-containing protein